MTDSSVERRRSYGGEGVLTTLLMMLERVQCQDEDMKNVSRTAVSVELKTELTRLEIGL